MTSARTLKAGGFGEGSSGRGPAVESGFCVYQQAQGLGQDAVLRSDGLVDFNNKFEIGTILHLSGSAAEFMDVIAGAQRFPPSCVERGGNGWVGFR